MAWGWRRSGGAKSSPTERSRIGWLEDHGITPMNRSTRLWDMEITAHHFVPHRTERVGCLDMTRHALAQQRGGEKIDPIKFVGSQNMATGRAYDFCYCIEAVNEEADGRTGCQCQCVDCDPPGKDATPNHWRKRHHASMIRAEMIRHKKKQNTWRKRTDRRIDDWVWLYRAWRRGDAEWRWEVLNRTPELNEDDIPTIPLNEEERG
jgi:hypothetical protein